jgi:predicted dehydrogenase
MPATIDPPGRAQSLPLRLGIIGLGGVGALHFAAYQQTARVKVVAAADVDPGRAALLAGTDTQFYEDYQALLLHGDLDAVCILTPAASHEAITLDCAASGLSILCEKPLAVSLVAVDRMIAACKKAGVTLFYGASYRYLPAIITARAMIAAGVIGDVLVMREQVIGGTGLEGYRELGPAHYPAGGPGGSGLGLMDHGIHLIDLFGWLCGAPVIASCGAGNIAGQAPRPEWLSMTFANGALGLLTYHEGSFGTELPGEGLFTAGAGWDTGGFVAAGDWSATPGLIHVHGTRGALRIAHYANQLVHFDARGAHQIALTGRPSPFHFAAQIEAFADVVAGTSGGVPACVGREALRIALTAYQ